MPKNRHIGYNGVDRNREFPNDLYKATIYGDLSFYNQVKDFADPYEGKVHFDKRKNEFR